VPRKQIIWIIVLNLISGIIFKIGEHIIRNSPDLTPILLKYFSVNPYYALFIGAVNVVILLFILRKKRPLFFDDFRKYEGWEPTKFDNYIGKISICTTFARSHGRCLKKDFPNDPHGGFKVLPKKINGNFSFTGWLFSEMERHTEGVANRIAIEDATFSGYGFMINHSDGRLCIEKRDRGQAIHISRIKRINVPNEKWYKFELRKKRDRITLSIIDEMKNVIDQVSTVDNTYSSFDRVVVHGGSPYYLDDLEIK
jgi:hypothetical protein